MRLSDREHVRKRPSMYIGDTTARGLHHLPGELVSNSVDEFLQGRLTIVRIKITDGVVEVTDDGAGMPFDLPSKFENESLADDYFTRFHDKPTADDHAPHVHVHSPIGVGLTVVNALSQWMHVETWREGKFFERRFECGVPKPVDVRVGENAVRPFFDSTHHVAEKRGTRISFQPDPEIFQSGLIEPRNLRRKLFDAVHLTPGLLIELQNERFHAPNGLLDLAAFETLYPYGRAFNFDAEVAQLLVRAVAVGNTANGKETKWHTWANGIRTWYTPSSGTHEDAFSKALGNVDWQPSAAFIHVIAKEPRFAGPTRTKLGMPEKEEPMVAALTEALSKYVKEHHSN